MARITNYVDGNTLTGAQLNNEIDNIWNNGPSLVSLSIPAISTVQGLHGSIVSNIGSFQANGYQLRSTSVICSLSATSSYSINTQTAGPIANGRDQAAAFASTQVHFYAITTGGSSTNAAGICSTRPPSLGPLLPAGYSAWAYLTSCIYTVATSVVTRSVQVAGSRADTNEVILVTVGTATTATALNAGGAVPSVATAMRIRMYNLTVGSTGAGGTAGADFIVQPAASVAGGALRQTISAVPQLSSASISAAEAHPGVTGLVLNIETTPTVYYSATLAAGAAVSLGMDVGVSGYTVPNGDVG